MSDEFTATKIGNDAIDISSVILLWLVAHVLFYKVMPWTTRVAAWVVLMCEPVQVPTGQTNNHISEDTTSHTHKHAGPKQTTEPEPSLTRARTRKEDNDQPKAYERVRVRDKLGRWTKNTVMIEIDWP